MQHKQRSTRAVQCLSRTLWAGSSHRGIDPWWEGFGLLLLQGTGLCCWEPLTLALTLKAHPDFLLLEKPTSERQAPGTTKYFGGHREVNSSKSCWRNITYVPGPKPYHKVSHEEAEELPGRTTASWWWQWPWGARSCPRQAVPPQDFVGAWPSRVQHWEVISNQKQYQQ